MKSNQGVERGTQMNKAEQLASLIKSGEMVYVNKDMADYSHTIMFNDGSSVKVNIDKFTSEVLPKVTIDDIIKIVEDGAEAWVYLDKYSMSEGEKINGGDFSDGIYYPIDHIDDDKQHFTVWDDNNKEVILSEVELNIYFTLVEEW